MIMIAIIYPKYIPGATYIWLKATEPALENSLLLTTKFLGVPGTHLINLGAKKAELTLEPPVFLNLFPWIGFQCPYD